MLRAIWREPKIQIKENNLVLHEFTNRNSLIMANLKQIEMFKYAKFTWYDDYDKYAS